MSKTEAKGTMTEYVVENAHGSFRIVRNAKYGFWEVSPAPSPEALAAFYQKHYQNPTYSFHEELYVWLLRTRLPSLFEKGGRVLELGCGQGNLLRALSDVGLRVFGFEPGEADWLSCTQKGLKTVENAAFDPGVAAQNGPYDLVMMIAVLEHVPHPQVFLEQIRELVSPGGYLFLLVPNDFNPFQEAFVAKTGEHRWFLEPPEHVNYFTPESLQDLVRALGWKVLHRTTRFPIDMFLLMGRNYISSPELGRPLHLERVEFERSFLDGREETLWNFYDALAQANVGREIILLCQRPVS